MEQRSLKTQKREIERLVEKAQEGDEESFAALYDLFINPLYRYVYFRCNGTDPEDLLTTIFMKVWMNLKRYQFQDASFSAWVFRIAHNVVVDFYRANQQNQTVQELDENHYDQRPENASSHVVTQRLHRELLKKALAKLQENYQQIIVLKYLNGLENREIAEILSRSENSLRILQYRALRALRKILMEMGITDYTF